MMMGAWTRKGREHLLFRCRYNANRRFEYHVGLRLAMMVLFSVCVLYEYNKYIVFLVDECPVESLAKHTSVHVPAS